MASDASETRRGSFTAPDHLRDLAEMVPAPASDATEGRSSRHGAARLDLAALGRRPSTPPSPIHLAGAHPPLARGNPARYAPVRPAPWLRPAARRPRCACMQDFTSQLESR